MLILTIILMGAATIYHLIGQGRWAWFDCLYMTVITLSTVGYGETLEGFHQVPAARPVTIALIVLGSGTLLYFISNLTALIVEGDLGADLLRRRMKKQIAKLEKHIIVCGVGTTGQFIVKELMELGIGFVVIESDEHRIQVLMEEITGEFPYVVGDATNDHVLAEAGIDRCKGVISALHDDRDNLFVTVSVRALNPNATIVAKAVEAGADKKILRAGADRVVSPNFIGGMRLVSEMIRPTAVEFIDRMLRDREQNLRIDEAHIPAGSRLVGQPLSASGVRESGALVVAIRAVGGEYVYKPKGDLILEADSHLIVIAQAEDLKKLRATLRQSS